MSLSQRTLSRVGHISPMGHLPGVVTQKIGLGHFVLLSYGFIECVYS